MAKLTISPPATGEKVTIAEPKVSTILKEIETWANGEVGTNNIKAGDITEAMLAVALQEKLVTNVGLVIAESAISLEGANGTLYKMSKAGTTLTLPAPTANHQVAVFAGAAIKVKASAGAIVGDFTSAAEVNLTAAQHLWVIADGVNWAILAGEPKPEATQEAQVARVSGTEYEPSASRPCLVTVQFTAAFGKEGKGKVLVGATEVGRLSCYLPGINSFTSLTFRTNPGEKWQVKLEANAEELKSSYRLL